MSRLRRITSVAVEKVLQWQKLPKLGDRKCIPRWRKSFIGHPSASRFLCEDAERVFQQPRLLAGSRRKMRGEGRRHGLSCVTSSRSAVSERNQFVAIAIGRKPCALVTGP